MLLNSEKSYATGLNNVATRSRRLTYSHMDVDLIGFENYSCILVLSLDGARQPRKSNGMNEKYS